MAQKMAGYTLRYQQCSDQVQLYTEMIMDLSCFAAIYGKAYKEWMSDPTNLLFEPPIGDEKKKVVYFAKCDEICCSKPQNLHEYIGNNTGKPVGA
jgi:hypothetical protein